MRPGPCLPEGTRAHALSTDPGLGAMVTLHTQWSVRRWTPGDGWTGQSGTCPGDLAYKLKSSSVLGHLPLHYVGPHRSAVSCRPYCRPVDMVLVPVKNRHELVHCTVTSRRQ